MINTHRNKFIGSWKLIEADTSLDLGDNDEMVFTKNGDLFYGIDAGSKWQIVKLIYKIENGILITDQPSSPNEEKTKYYFDENGILFLDYHGAVAKYQKIKKCSFSI
ncbi:MAG: hypothetical protein QNJ01_16530 [Desulfobacterales bacterium]|nr:hypothetical protein [Desulfobacterales bacterium]